MRLVEHAAEYPQTSIERVLSATHRYAHFAEEGETFPHVDQSDLLWSARRQPDRGWETHVETMTAPSTLTSWPRLSWTSPVPGGMSSTSTSRTAPCPR